MFLSLLQFLPQSFWFWRFIWKAAAFRGPSLPGRKPKPFSALRAGDPAAREKLIRHNLRLVAHIVKNTTPCPAIRTTLFPSAPSA